ncbi:MAG: DUF2442 domain-containing protein [Pseudomonadota bacterium]
MNPRVSKATPNKDFTMTLTFTNGETRIFDVRPYLGRGDFQELKDSHYFQRLSVFEGTVTWPNEQDFCPDTLYLESIPVDGDDLAS